MRSPGSATTAAMPIASYVDKFRAEFQAHIDHGGCPFGGAASLEDAFVALLGTGEGLAA